MIVGKFKIGQKVCKRLKRDQIGFVSSDPEKISGEFWYKVEFIKGRKKAIPESDLELFAEINDPIELFINRSFSTKDALTRLIAYSKLSNPSTFALSSIKASKTSFEPYQYKPLIKFLESNNNRLLIADEVGLGKTIEAGHILLELFARESIERVLIICPNSLKYKWKVEMEEKFSFDFDIQSSRSFIEKLDDYVNKNGNVRFNCIISMQSVRSKIVHEKLNEIQPSFDLIIFDEAHHLRNDYTRTFKVGKLLSSLASGVLFLTATPIHLGNRNLFNLLKILDEDEFQNYHSFCDRIENNQPILKTIQKLRLNNPDYLNCREGLSEVELGIDKDRFLTDPFYQRVMNELNKPVERNRSVKIIRDLNNLWHLSHIVSRTRKRDVKQITIRTVQTETVNFSDIELEFYWAVTEFVRDQAGASSKSFGIFVTMMPQRQIASSIPAMVEYYETKLRNGENLVSENSNFNDIDILDIEDENLLNSLEPHQKLLLIIDKYKDRIAGQDSKLNSLLSAMDAMKSKQDATKFIVFSFFKKTLNYLSRELNNRNINNLVISGDYSIEERNNRIDKFKTDANINVLLSSEVGSEGLDLQFSNVIVNYDLPWNPMVVEQRIGRIDRIGQEANKIFIINFSTKGTIEERILDRLYSRIGIFENTLGDLEDILGESIEKLTMDLLSQKLTPEEEIEKIEATERQINNNKIEAEELQKSGQQLISNDQYFMDEIDSIIRNHKYISSDELRIFVSEFLLNNYPAARLMPTKMNNIFTIGYCNNFRYFLKTESEEISRVLYEFLSIYIKPNRNPVYITFDSEVARNNRKILFINRHHPIIKKIVNYYQSNYEQLHPVSSIKIQTNKVNDGIFLFLIYEGDIQGVRSKCIIIPIFMRISNDNHQLLSEEESNILMNEIITKGDSWYSDFSFEKNIMLPIFEKMEIVGLKRFAIEKDEYKATNETLRLRQKSSLKKTYDIKSSSITNTISKMKSIGREERWINLHRSRLEAVRLEGQEKIKMIEESSTFNAEGKILGVGVVNVEAV